MNTTTAKTWDMRKDDIINLRDSVLQDEYFTEQRPRSKQILEKFFDKAVSASSKLEMYVLLDEIMNSYEPPEVDEIKVRAQLRAIQRHQLPQFFVTHGKRLPFKAEIVKAEDRRRSWYLQFSHNDPGIGDCVQGFWQPYFTEKESLLVLGASLFFRDRRGNVVRNLGVNDARERKHLYPLAGKQVEEMEPTSYIHAGHMRAAFNLVELFHEHRRHLRYDGGAGLSDHMVEQNLVVLGNPRTSPAFAAIQDNSACRLRIEDRYILDDDQRIDDKVENGSHGVCYRAVVTRCLNFDGRHLVTMLGSNHGKNAVGVAGFLTRQADMVDLYRCLGRQTASVPLPSHFQALFKITVKTDPEQTILRTELEKAYVYDPRPNLVGNARRVQKMSNAPVPLVRTARAGSS